MPDWRGRRPQINRGQGENSDILRGLSSTFGETSRIEHSAGVARDASSHRPGVYSWEMGRSPECDPSGIIGDPTDSRVFDACRRSKPA
jgi:hypothetical protein